MGSVSSVRFHFYNSIAKKDQLQKIQKSDATLVHTLTAFQHSIIQNGSRNFVWILKNNRKGIQFPLLVRQTVDKRGVPNSDINSDVWFPSFSLIFMGSALK